ncbi:MAG: CBS domain-containing protein [Alphaproteobacteria bacterium]|nr:CBS domain-containing protein [Alphaproteobacteria bacterium]
MTDITRIEDWMSRPLVTAPMDATTETVARLMLGRQIRHVPLLRADGRCAGVVCDAEVFATGAFVEDDTWMERKASAPLDLARPLGGVLHHTDELPYALAAMERAQSDHALILSGTGRPVGIFTEHDAVRAAAALLPPGRRFVAGAPVQTVPRTMRAEEALTHMVTAMHRHLIVLDDHGCVAGVVSVRDLAGADEGLTAGEVVPAHPLHTMPPECPLRWVAGELARFKIGCLVELDVKGAPVGVVTRTDIARALLEEYDAGEDTAPWRLPPGDLLASS